MSNEIELAKPIDLNMERTPADVLGEARNAAAALKDVISRKKKPVIFNGEQYLEFEDLQTLGRFYGITAMVTETKFIQAGDASGYQCRAVAMHVPSGKDISAADAICLDNERNWKGKPLFQILSMAQTRACAKALRNVLAWVVVLAGYKPSPAEEMIIDVEHAPATKPEPQPDTQTAWKNYGEKAQELGYSREEANQFWKDWFKSVSSKELTVSQIEEVTAGLKIHKVKA